jgi:hypothetical protein
MQLTIKKLRQSGFKVRVIHTRHYETLNQMKLSGPYSRLSGKGGATKIEVTTPDKTITVSAEAKCSLQDSFNRKLGNSIALGRVVSKLAQFEHVRELLTKI